MSTLYHYHFVMSNGDKINLSDRYDLSFAMTDNTKMLKVDNTIINLGQVVQIICKEEDIDD